MISICGACGQLGRESASFCHECGTSLGIETVLSRRDTMASVNITRMNRMSEEHSGIKVLRMPRRYSIPLLGRYLCWRLGIKIVKSMKTIDLNDIVIHTGIPQDKWQGHEVGIRE